MMNPSKVEEGNLQYDLGPHKILGQSQPLNLDNNSGRPCEEEDDDHFSLPDIVFFRDDDDEDDASHTSSDAELPQHNLPQLQPQLDDSVPQNPNASPNFCLVNGDSNNVEKRHLYGPPYIHPEPHMSSQFYTFNKKSYALMIRCILEERIATADEVRTATPSSVLSSWRSVWKDRNEDTAYVTAWKRIQDKLSARVDAPSGNKYLYFKSSSHQYVSHVDLWHDIVTCLHSDADCKHLGVKDTIDRIKQNWTVGAKFYGIPESYIRAFVASCPVCSDESSECAPRSKRRRFEYTESIDVPAKEVPARLQELAAKHKVVLCIRQKYIRYKPFMAEVKDYACHRAGEPASSKKSKILKPYVSKRCGCGFRIRAIVPITNYNEKDKTFVYQEEGIAVFKLYAVHSGHQPGPWDGNARIMHRVLGHQGRFLMDQETIYGISEEADNDEFGFMGKANGDMEYTTLQQVQEVRNEIGLLEGEIGKIPRELLCSVSHELVAIVHKLRTLRECGTKSVGSISDKQPSDDVLVGENDLADWGDHHHHHQRIYEDAKDTEFIQEDEDSFGRTLGEVASWGQIRTCSRLEKDELGGPCKRPEKQLMCVEFDVKCVPDCGDSKLSKPLRHDESIDADVGFAVENFYPENPKWFDSPCGLDSGADCDDDDFRHGRIV